MKVFYVSEIYIKDSVFRSNGIANLKNNNPEDALNELRELVIIALKINKNLIALKDEVFISAFTPL